MIPLNIKRFPSLDYSFILIFKSIILQSAPSQNGTSNNVADHPNSTAETTSEAVPSSKTVEPKAVVVEPAEAAPVAPPASTIEPMETDQLSTPPEKVPEKPNATDDVIESSKPVEKVDAPVEQPEKSDAKETTEVTYNFNFKFTVTASKFYKFTYRLAVLKNFPMNLLLSRPKNLGENLSVGRKR